MLTSSHGVVDIAFGAIPVNHGESATVPADHGFALFSAISRVLPFVHGNPLIGGHPLPGTVVGERKMLLRSKPFS